MATVFETRLIGNIGKDAVIKTMERNLLAINFPVAHNKNWKDKRTGQTKTKTTWVNCTIWKRDGSNMRIMDFLKKGTMVELIGSPFAKAYSVEGGGVRTEIRLNVSSTNILRPVNREGDYSPEDLIDREEEDDDTIDTSLEDFTMDESDF